MGRSGQAYDTETRTAAAMSYIHGQACAAVGASQASMAKSAIDHFLKTHPNFKRGAAGKLINRCGKLLKVTGSVADVKGTGMKPKVTAQQTALIRDIIREGYKADDGRQLWWRSMAHAIHSCSELRDMMQQAGVRFPRTLQRAVQRDHPEIKSKRIRTQKALTDKAKAGRVKCCKDINELLQEDPEAIKRIVWLDSKVYNVEATETDSYFVDTSLPNTAVVSD
jgi:hypothetical protein